MSRPIQVAVLLLVAVTASVVLTNGIAVSQEGRGAGVRDVVCVNWPLIFERARDIADANRWCEDQVQQLSLRQDEFKAWVTTKREELELLPAGSEAHEKLRDEIERRLWDRESDDAYTKRKIGARQLEARHSLDIRARKVIADYAKKHGIHIVHAFHQMEIDPSRLKNPEQLAGAIASRSVLYWDESVDITDEILAILNAE